MATPSLSFRISRSAEDLAETIHALSQRLVLLEQRLAVMEQQVVSSAQPDPAELESLSNVERLLQDCRQLLTAESLPQPQPLPRQPEPEQDAVFLDAA
ncbi:MAG: hypothetical protein WAM11_08250 [Cyanobium sp.]